MLGKTNGMNPVDTGLSSGDLVCWFWGRTRNSSTPDTNVVYAYNRDYLTYNSNVFTVLKDFDATIKIVGSGTRTGSSGSSGNYPLTYTFTINSSVFDTGSITYTGNGTPSAQPYSFKEGDTFRVTGADGISTYMGDIGYFIEIA